MRAEALASRRAEMIRGLDSRRAALGALAEELAKATGAKAATIRWPPASSASASRSPRRWRVSRPPATPRPTPIAAPALARIRESAERAAQIARRVEDMLGDRQQDSLSARIEREAELIAALEDLSGAAADARDAAGERAAALERRMLGETGEDTVTEQLRACSREEAELQAQLRAIGEQVTEAEVRVAHLGDRRAEAASELAKIAATLGREIGPADRGARRG